MTRPLILSARECQGRAWHPPQDLSFAQYRALIPLHAGELAKAASSMPLAVIRQGREWRLVAVCGLENSHNLFIRQGEWLAQHRPDWLTTWPFAMLSIGDRRLVVVDQDAVLMDADEPAGGAEPFFDAHHQMAQAVANRVEALKAVFRKQELTARALEALDDAGALTPWPETLRASLGLAIEGLHMVDEKALSQLDDEAFLSLRKAQALPIAYALNLSIPQTHLLTRLARLNPAQPQVDTPENLDSFFEGDEELSFDFGN